MRGQVIQHILRPVFGTGQGSGDRHHGPVGHDHLSARLQEGQEADRLSGFKADDQVCFTAGNHRGINAFPHAQVAEHAAAPLRHADGFRGHDGDIPGHGCGGNEAGSQDGSLAADAAEDNILTHGNSPPLHGPGRAARTGRSRCTAPGQ